MEYKRFGNTLAVRLDKGDEIIESLLAAAKQENIRAGFFTGIGATDDCTVGVFDTKQKIYQQFSFTENHEINTLAGNFSTMNGEPYLHAHITCTGPAGQVVGGHLLRGVISLTAEIFITIVDADLLRRKDAEIGINKITF